jgi:AraC-like DNA-binding protein
MDSSGILPTHRFDSTMFAEADQFPAFAAFTARSRVTRLDGGDGPFSAMADFWVLDRLVVSHQTVDPFILERDEHYLRVTPPTHFTIVLPIDGTCQFIAPGIDQQCGPGDVICASLTRTSRGICHQRQRQIAISIARGFVEEAAGPVEIHGCLPPSPQTELFFAFMRSLVQQLPHTPVANAPALSRILRDLFVNAVSIPLHRDSPSETLGLPARARAYIERQPPGALDVEAMVRDIAVTRSTLYRLFQGEGGIVAYDRRRRLRLLHHALADPLDRRSLAQLGYEYGFADPAHLARLFKRSFGYSMSDLRSQLRAAPIKPTVRGRTPADDYREIVGDLL